MWPAKPEDCIAHCRSRLTQDERDIAVAMIDLYAWAVALAQAYETQARLKGEDDEGA